MSIRTRSAVVMGSMILLALIPTAFLSAQSTSGGVYTVRKFVIAGGGGDAQGAPYRASVTVGQSAAMVSNGGSYRLISGFHQAQTQGSTVDALFCSNFEDTPCTPGANP